ncbi:hypothetical protein GCM10023065_15760 [Microbacterium laevaniformans]|nr:hypothetical protein GCM10017578_02920 [Microbacterium laevaniformans]
MLDPVSDIALVDVRRLRKPTGLTPPDSEPGFHGLEAVWAVHRGVAERVAGKLDEHAITVRGAGPSADSFPQSLSGARPNRPSQGAWFGRLTPICRGSRARPSREQRATDAITKNDPSVGRLLQWV